jgi:diguanylate cyclase (GGDEF)-like protein
MSEPAQGPAAVRGRRFSYSVLAVGLVCTAIAVAGAVRDGFQSVSIFELATVPLIVVIARFPMVLDRTDGGIEVGFDSSILMFLLCTVDSEQAVVLWALGVLFTQLTTDKIAIHKIFNVGVGTIGGSISALIITGVRGNAFGTPLELLGVFLAATAYFFTDFLITALYLKLETDAPFREMFLQRGTVIAMACFVPFDSLGYLGAVVVRSTPWWTLILLAVPLATLLVATRAVTRGGENARRLSVLFDAAVRAQTLSDPEQVVDALREDARRLLRLREVSVRGYPPDSHEIGAQLRDGVSDRWIVAAGTHRARSTSAADQQALEALVAVASDAFSRLRLTDDMTHLARHDLLTNLPNRGLLLDRVQHALQLSRRRGSRIALLFVDLDGFKPVNDRFGHAAGDSVLVDVARRLASCVRSSDTVARLGGDEFAILLEDVRPAEVQAACERILTALSRGVHVAGHELSLSASIGVAFGDTSETADSMLRNADLAMYEAKSRGKDQFVSYERSIGRSRLQRLELVESLRASISAGELSVVYQPVVRANTGRIVGVEALARWKSNGVDVPPDVFIKVAEESGLIVALGDVILARAGADAAALMEAAGGDLNIAVNVSARQLRETDFVHKVERVMATMAGAKLVLEITERDAIGEDPASLDTMERLAAKGVRFAIDDFGIGFSSIGYLQDTPVHIIKTDASFSEGIDRDERSCALLCSITMMGQALGLDVVVEGIERGAQLEHVRSHVHAPFAQGYLLHRPMPAAEVIRVLRANQARGELQTAEPAPAAG